MTELTRWEPFQEMTTLRDAMSQLLTESFVRPRGGFARRSCALNDHGRPIRLPAATRRLLVQLRRTHAELTQHLGREPTTAELSARIGVAQQQVEEILPLLQEPLSLEAPIDADGETALEELVPDMRSGDVEELVVERLAQDYIRVTLSKLTPEEQQVLTLRYGLDDGRFRALEEVGALLGLRRDLMRKIEGRALRKLRHPSLAARLVDHHGMAD